MKACRLMLCCLVLMVTKMWVAPTVSLADAKRGEEVYKTLCWTCHGSYGRGDGPAAKFLAYPPPDLTDPRVLGSKSDQEIAGTLIDGKGQTGTSHRMMVIGEVLKKQALLDAIAYMRGFAGSGKGVSIAAGKDIYNTFCSSCHGVKGDGKGPAAKNLVGVKPRDFTSKDFVIKGREEEVRRTIFEGAAKTFHGSPYMPQWKTTLSDAQVTDLIEYLKTFKQ
jgi:mono/diheme cytochrome c family protein